MRSAELEHLKSKFSNGGPPQAPKLMQLMVADLPGFSDCTLEPKSTFITLCGGTGVGKTALLELINFALIDLRAGVDPKCPPRLGEAQITLHLQTAGQNYFQVRRTKPIPIADDLGFQPGSVFVRLHHRTTEAQALFFDKDLEALTNGVDPLQFDRPLLAMTSAACRKTYKSIRAYEIEVGAGEILPYFQVEADETSYDNLSMATGELSVLYLAWALRNADPQSVVLVEEPESHLPPCSHDAVFAMLADFALRKHLCLIVTTHSSALAVHAPPDGLISINRAGSSSSMVSSKDARDRSLIKLGLKPSVKAVFFVEDTVASISLNEILVWLDIGRLVDWEIAVIEQGSGAIRKIVEAGAGNAKSVKLVGVLDGDMKADAARWGTKEKFVFLPFDRSIESEILKLFEANTHGAASLLGCTCDALCAAIEESIGRDDHDRIVILQRRLGFTERDFVTNGMKFWKKGNMHRVNEIKDCLASKLGIEL